MAGAVRQAARGGGVLDPKVTGLVFDRLRRGPGKDARLSQLTHREHVLLDLIAEGLANREIAARL